jgi:hypothetical protein
LAAYGKSLALERRLREAEKGMGGGLGLGEVFVQGSVLLLLFLRGMLVVGRRGGPRVRDIKLAGRLGWVMLRGRGFVN